MARDVPAWLDALRRPAYTGRWRCWRRGSASRSFPSGGTSSPARRPSGRRRDDRILLAGDRDVWLRRPGSIHGNPQRTALAREDCDAVAFTVDTP